MTAPVNYDNNAGDSVNTYRSKFLYELFCKAVLISSSIFENVLEKSKV